METNQAVEVEIVDMPMELSVFDPLKVKIQEAKEKNALLAFDYKDKQGNKDARSWVAQLRTLKAPVSELHKTGKAEALKYCNEWDKAKNDIITGIEEMIEYHDKPLREIKDAEAKKKADEEAKIKAEEERVEAERLAEIEAREKEFAQKQIELAAEAVCLKAKQDELERKERETRIAEDAKKKAAIEADNKLFQAEEKAKQDAINAENARKQAVIEAENAKAAAVQKAKDEATAQASAIEAQLTQDRRAEEARVAEEQAAEQLRQADTDHRSDVHRDIYLYLLAPCGIDKQSAEAIVHTLIDGKIPHVSIQY